MFTHSFTILLLWNENKNIVLAWFLLQVQVLDSRNRLALLTCHKHIPFKGPRAYISATVQTIQILFHLSCHCGKPLNKYSVARYSWVRSMGHMAPNTDWHLSLCWQQIIKWLQCDAMWKLQSHIFCLFPFLRSVHAGFIALMIEDVFNYAWTFWTLVRFFSIWEMRYKMKYFIKGVELDMQKQRYNQ